MIQYELDEEHKLFLKLCGGEAYWDTYQHAFKVRIMGGQVNGKHLFSEMWMAPPFSFECFKEHLSIMVLQLRAAEGAA